MTKAKSAATPNPIPTTKAKTSPKPESKKRQGRRLRRKMTLKEEETAAAVTLLLAQRQARASANAAPMGVIMMQGETYGVILPTTSLRPCVPVPSSSSVASAARPPLSGSQALSSATPPCVFPTAPQFGPATSRLGLSSEDTSPEITSQPFAIAPPPIDLNVTPVLLDATPRTDDAPPIHSKAPRAVPAGNMPHGRQLFEELPAMTRADPLRVIEGAIPADFPAGTYYLAGPGMFSDDHGSTVHPLDGHGYLRSFRFHPNHGVHYSARYVETAAKTEEKGEGASWRFTHRGPFSVLQGGHRVGNVKVMKNVANTSVLWWGGRLLCLWEGGMPYELDPDTLETLGPFDLLGLGDEAAAAQGRGTVPARRRQRRPWLVEAGVDVATRLLRPVLSGVFSMPPKRLLAHYKVDPKRNRLLMVACNAEDMLLPRANFTFYEFDASFGLVQKREFVLPAHLMIHDWAFTDSHYVILGNRIKLDIPGSMLAMTGTHPMIGALALDPSKQTTPVYLLPRSTEAVASGRDWTVPVEAPTQMWSMHVGNAFEEDNAHGGMDIRLHMSGCSYQWFHFHRMFGYNWKNKKLDPSFMNVVRGKELLPRLVQVSIELDKRGACRRCSVKGMSHQWNKPADFPAINPSFANKRSRFIYAGGASGSRKFLPYFPFDSVVKVDVSDGSSRRWSSQGRTFVGEPVFIPAGGGEDHGYVILVEYAVYEDRCNLVVLDARKLGKRSALVAKLEVPKHLTFPMGFHGFWADE